MTEPAKVSSPSARPTGTRRPVWVGWSVAAVILAVASVVIATGVSDRGAGVRLPPAIDIGTGLTWQPAATAPPAQMETTTEPPTTEAPPDTSQVQTSSQPRSDAGASDNRSSTTDRSGSGSDGQTEPRESPTTVPPNYPVVTGGSTDSQPAGGTDS